MFELGLLQRLDVVGKEEENAVFRSLTSTQANEVKTTFPRALKYKILSARKTVKYFSEAVLVGI